MLEFWYEFASTYSYLTAPRIADEARRADVPLVWRPFLLGPIFQRQGWKDSPFNIYPAKGRYMWRDLERRARAYGYNFRKPSQFPRNGLRAARIAVTGQDEDWIGEFTKRVYIANFEEDRDIAGRDELERILRELSLDVDAILGAAASNETKQKLRTQTEEAQALDIFGAPAFIVRKDGQEPELFWGDDRLADALEWARR